MVRVTPVAGIEDPGFNLALDFSRLLPTLASAGADVVGRLTRSRPLSRSPELPVCVARFPAAPLCETPTEASDTDVLQSFLPPNALFAM
jgi:hypothetical protein